MTDTAATDTQDQRPSSPICRNCWWRRATPGFDRCTICFHTPHKHRANAKWAHLIDAANAADTTTRKAA